MPSKFSTIVINSDEEKLQRGLWRKSEALAETGKVDINMFLINALRLIGRLLPHNLALNYYNKGDLDNTFFGAEKALNLDKFQCPFLLSAYALSDKEWGRAYYHSSFSYQRAKHNIAKSCREIQAIM